MTELNEIVTQWLTWEMLFTVAGFAIAAFCLRTLHVRATSRRKKFEQHIQAMEAERSRQLASAEQARFATASFRHAGGAKSRA